MVSELVKNDIFHIVERVLILVLMEYGLGGLNLQNAEIQQRRSPKRPKTRPK